MENLIKLQEVDDRSKSNQRRIEKLETDMKDYQQLVTTMATFSQKQESIESDVKEIKGDIKAIRDKPAKRWESVVEKVIMVVLGALVTFFLAKAGIV